MPANYNLHTRIPRPTASRIASRNLYVIIPAIIACLSACSSVEIDPSRTTFNTRITESRLKHFEVRIKKDQTSLPSRLSDNPDVRRSQIQKFDPKRLSKQLAYAADFHVAKTVFCRTGYWIIETNTYNPSMTLRAECNEPASEQDITNFPNTFTHW